MIFRKVVRRAKDILDFLRTGSLIDFVEADDVGPVDLDPDSEPDCTGKIHRPYCREFDRETKSLYWKPYDEVTESGQYVRVIPTFGCSPQFVTIMPFEGKLVEMDFSKDQTKSLPFSPLDVHSIYLGPLPEISKSLVNEWW